MSVSRENSSPLEEGDGDYTIEEINLADEDSIYRTDEDMRDLDRTSLDDDQSSSNTVIFEKNNEFSDDSDEEEEEAPSEKLADKGNESWCDDPSLKFTEKVDGIFVLASDLNVIRQYQIQFPIAFEKPLHAIARSIRHYKGLKERVIGFDRLIEISLFTINSFSVKVLVFHTRSGGLPYDATCKAVQKGLEQTLKTLAPDSKTRINFFSHIDKWITVWNRDDWGSLGKIWNKMILRNVRKKFKPVEETDIEDEDSNSEEDEPPSDEEDESDFEEKFKIKFIIFKSGQSCNVEDFEPSHLDFLNPVHVQAFYLHFALDLSLNDHHVFFKPEAINEILADEYSRNRQIYRVGLIPGLGNVTYDYIYCKEYPCHHIKYYGKIHSTIPRDRQQVLTNQIVSPRCAEIYGSFFENKIGKVRLNDRDKKMRDGEVSKVLSRVLKLSGQPTEGRVEVVVSCSSRSSIEDMVEATFRRARRVLYKRKNIKKNLAIYKPIKTIEYCNRMAGIWPYIIGTYEYCISRVYKIKQKSAVPRSQFSLDGDEVLTLEDFSALRACDHILQGWLRGDLKMYKEWKDFLGMDASSMRNWNPQVLAQQPQLIFQNLELIESPVKRIVVPENMFLLVNSFSKFVFSKYPNATKQILTEINNLKRLPEQAGSKSMIEARLVDGICSLLLVQTSIGIDYFPSTLNFQDVASNPEWTNGNYNFRLITAQDFVFELVNPSCSTFDNRWKFIKELLKYIKSTLLVRDLNDLLAEAMSCAALTHCCPFAIWAKKGEGLAILPNYNSVYDKGLFNTLWRNSFLVFFEEFSVNQNQFLSVMARFHHALELVPLRLRENLTVDRLMPFFVSLIEGGDFPKAEEFWGPMFTSTMKGESRVKENRYGLNVDDLPNNNIDTGESEIIRVAPSTKSLRNPISGKFMRNINTSANTNNLPKSKYKNVQTQTGQSFVQYMPELSRNEVKALYRIPPSIPIINSSVMEQLRIWFSSGRPSPTPQIVDNLFTLNPLHSMESNFDGIEDSNGNPLDYAQTYYGSAVGSSPGQSSVTGSYATALEDFQMGSQLEEIDRMSLDNSKENIEQIFLTWMEIKKLHINSPKLPIINRTTMIDLRVWLKSSRPTPAPSSVENLLNRSTNKQSEKCINSLIGEIELVNLAESIQEIDVLCDRFQSHSIGGKLVLDGKSIKILHTKPPLLPMVDKTVMSDVQVWLQSGRPEPVPQLVEDLFQSTPSGPFEPPNATLEPDDSPCRSLNVPLIENSSIPDNEECSILEEEEETLELGSTGSIQTLSDIIKKVHMWQKKNKEAVEPTKFSWKAPTGRKYNLRAKNIEGDVHTDDEFQVPEEIKPNRRRRRTRSRPIRKSNESEDEEEPPKSPKIGSLPKVGSLTVGLSGLKNLGNTCYINSVIQCLSKTKPLLDFLLEDNFQITTVVSSLNGALLTAFSKVVQKLWRGSGIVDPSGLKTQIDKVIPNFRGSGQQDSQEFLRFLLGCLHDESNTVKNPPQTALEDIDDSLSSSEKAEEAWRRNLLYNDSEIQNIFVGQLKSSLKCTKCGHDSVTFDQCWDISLPISSGTTASELSECFKSFNSPEILDGQEMPTCSKCERKTKSIKSLAIQKFPSILVIHLKRFIQSGSGLEKLTTFVDFPVNDLNLSEFSTTSSSNSTYDLFGVSNHIGSIGDGHYTAYCRHPATGQWHCFNDSSVTPISSSKIVSSDGYLLFYKLNQPRSDSQE